MGILNPAQSCFHFIHIQDQQVQQFVFGQHNGFTPVEFIAEQLCKKRGDFSRSVFCLQRCQVLIVVFDLSLRQVHAGESYFHDHAPQKGGTRNKYIFPVFHAR